MTNDLQKLQDKIDAGKDLAQKSDLNLTAGRTQFPGVRLWGHRLSLGSTIECQECEMSEEVPPLLQESSAFREVVYKLYLLGKFKHTHCQQQHETDNSSLHTRTTNIGGSLVKMEIDDGSVITDGAIIYESTSDQYYAGDMLTEQQYMDIASQANNQ